MISFVPKDWFKVFAPEMPVLELIARGSLMYLMILVLMRIMPRRTGGEMATMDLIFVVLVANSASHALGDFSSIADSLIIVLTLVTLNFAFNFLSYNVPLIERLLAAPPLEVIRHGRLLHRNMRYEFLTEEEIMEQLRRRGVDHISEVRSAHIEADGKLSVIRKNQPSAPQ